MRYALYSLIAICLITAKTHAQPAFRNMDSLLTKNFEAVSLRDSAYYLSMLNLEAILPAKKLRTRNDSLKFLRPFTEAFTQMSAELREFAGSEEMEVKYESYTSSNTAYYDAHSTGKLLLQVSLLINNTFTVKVPFFVMANQGRFTIEQPMLVMFAE